jgi:hypothetical protein
VRTSTAFHVQGLQGALPAVWWDVVVSAVPFPGLPGSVLCELCSESTGAELFANTFGKMVMMPLVETGLAQRKPNVRPGYTTNYFQPLPEPP